MDDFDALIQEISANFTQLTIYNESADTKTRIGMHGLCSRKIALCSTAK